MLAIKYHSLDPLDDYPIRRDVFYLMDSILMSYFQRLYKKRPEVVQPVNLKPFLPDKDWNNKKILLIRHGAFGDILFLTPIIQQLKLNWPDVSITVCCREIYYDVLLPNSDVDDLICYPVPLDIADRFDAVVSFNNDVIQNADINNTHVVDAYAATLQLNVADKTLKFKINDYLAKKALLSFPRTDKVRIGIQVFSSNKVRSYPYLQTIGLIDKLTNENVEVFLFGSALQVPYQSKEGVVNLTAITPSLKLAESAAVMNTCDIFIAPDSSLCHIAGALSIPTIALFGPFPSSVRTSYASNIHVINAIAPCAPCFHHTVSGSEFPVKEVCAEKGYCVALNGIDPEQILIAVYELLDRNLTENVDAYQTIY